MRIEHEKNFKMELVCTMKLTKTVFFVLRRITQTISQYFFNICINVLRFRGDPLHIAFIADGNRTYSKQHGISRYEAYIKGMEKILHQVSLSSTLKATELTFFLFSSHNNRRNAPEKFDILIVVDLLLKVLLSKGADFRYNIVGDASTLPPNIHFLCNQLQGHSNLNARTVINLAINYSARIELVRASVRLLYQHPAESQITESLFDSLNGFHYTRKPDIIIRTSRQKRLSDFLTWQTVHGSLFFTDQCWPEFSDWSLIGPIFYHHFFTNRKRTRRISKCNAK